ncbi:Hypothetical protein A7982_01706 [Minicystis rosea]|nr:Hypothetical protein A7982_01706 [Minicystis rosea]
MRGSTVAVERGFEPGPCAHGSTLRRRDGIAYRDVAPIV